MFVKAIWPATVMVPVMLMSGCALVDSSTSFNAISAPASETISRSGSSEGPGNVFGTSFTSVVRWAEVGNGNAGIDNSALTLRHATTVSPSNASASSGLNVFAPGDTFEVEGSRERTNFNMVALTPNAVLGQFTETSGTGAAQRSYTAYSTIGFETSFSDIIALGRAGGSATYNGDAAIEVFESNGHSDAASGTSNVTVDFGANAFSGSLVFSDPVDGGSGVDITNLTLDVTGGSLVGNSFSGTLSGDASALGASSLGEITMDGSLYGAGGADLGGSFSASGTSAAMSGQDIVIIGGFLGTR